MPAPGRSSPPPWIELASLFGDGNAVAADLHGLTAVTLLGRTELETAVAVLVVVPVDKRHQPLTGLDLAAERHTRVIMSVHHRHEEFGVGIVIRVPWPG